MSLTFKWHVGWFVEVFCSPFRRRSNNWKQFFKMLLIRKKVWKTTLVPFGTLCCVTLQPNGSTFGFSFSAHDARKTQSLFQTAFSIPFNSTRAAFSILSMHRVSFAGSTGPVPLPRNYKGHLCTSPGPSTPVSFARPRSPGFASQAFHVNSPDS